MGQVATLCLSRIAGQDNGYEAPGEEAGAGAGMDDQMPDAAVNIDEGARDGGDDGPVGDNGDPGPGPDGLEQPEIPGSPGAEDAPDAVRSSGEGAGAGDQQRQQSVSPGRSGIPKASPDHKPNQQRNVGQSPSRIPKAKVRQHGPC